MKVKKEQDKKDAQRELKQNIDLIISPLVRQKKQVNMLDAQKQKQEAPAPMDQ